MTCNDLAAHLQQIVTASPEFSAIAGSRLYPVLLPEGSTVPAATYQLVSTRPLYVLDGKVNLTQSGSVRCLVEDIRRGQVVSCRDQLHTERLQRHIRWRQSH